MEIIERETVVIHQDLAGPLQEWTENFNLSFHPDEVIIRNINYVGSAANPGSMHGILANFIRSRDNVMFTFIDLDGVAYNQHSELRYRLTDTNQLLNGQVTFRARRLAPLAASIAIDTITFTLEFIRFEKRRDPVIELEKISKQFGGFFELFNPSAQVHSTTVKQQELETFTGVPQPIEIAPQAFQVLTEAQREALKKAGIDIESKKEKKERKEKEEKKPE